MTRPRKLRYKIYTAAVNVTSSMHKVTGGRLLDMINVSAKDFVAITDAEITDPKTSKLIEKTPFIALHRSNIIEVREDE